MVKQWVTATTGRSAPPTTRRTVQIRLLAEPFTVGGVAMQTPGDPTARPASSSAAAAALQSPPSYEQQPSNLRRAPRQGFQMQGRTAWMPT
ncbi:hypothetical protein ACFPN0_32150 [Kitasatospora cinereorecta]